jgi:hypothetical protein
MSDHFINSITSQLQGHKGPELEALVIGTNGSQAEIWGVDELGSTTLYNDVGFAAIGIGAWHAKSRLMQQPYENDFTLAPALAAMLAAKKSAEVAPGVSTTTDWHIVTRNGFIPVWPNVLAKANALYDQYEAARLALAESAVSELQQFLTPQSQEGSTQDAAKSRPAGGSTQTDARAGETAPDAPRSDEAGAQESH